MGGLSGIGAQAPGPLGILMLETRFPRWVGDVGNPASFAYPVRYRVVAGANPQRVVNERAAGLLQPFIDAARALEADGCAAITTSCGFLGLFQSELQAAVAIPVATSSLLQLAVLERSLPAGKVPGVLTVSADALTGEYLRAVGADPWTPVAGVAPDGEFVRAILGDQADLDPCKLRVEVLDAGAALFRDHPALGAIVLECTNMPPYAAALRAATGLPVFDVITLTDRLMASTAASLRR